VSQQINLYNPLFLRQEKHFSARTMMQALAVIAIGIAVLYAYALFDSRAAERNVQSYRDQLTTQRDQLVKLTAQIAAHGKSKTLEIEVARYEADLKARAATLEALNTGQFGNTSGFSSFLAAFGRTALPGVWLTGFTIGDSGNELLVNGRALRADLVPDYLAALNGETMMRGRRVTEMKLASKEAAPVARSAEKDRRAEPERYVEFVLQAPLQVAAPASSKGSTP
jgi:hypothetical protein